MKFSAKEMNDFTAMTSQNAGKTYFEAPKTTEVKKAEAHPKNFYEQLLDN